MDLLWSLNANEARCRSLGSTYTMPGSISRVVFLRECFTMHLFSFQTGDWISKEALYFQAKAEWMREVFTGTRS